MEYIGRDFPMVEKIKLAEEIINRDINQDVLDNSILLIGPMGVGKSTISYELSRKTGMERIALDNEKQLEYFYRDRANFEDFKDFEFYLTSSLLTSLEKPAIIDFGAGHSVYENPVVFQEMQTLISRFKNVELILPSEDKNEALQIINNRIKSRGNKNLKSDFDTNRHFIEMPCNELLATDIVYTNGKSIDEVSSNIIKNVSSKKITI